MNGIHDMGGMHGFGPLAIEENEPVFHEVWEARCFALNFLMGGWRKWNIDMSRHSLERLSPDIYVTREYYERWAEKLELLLLETKLISDAELRNHKPDPDQTPQTPPINAEAIHAIMLKGRPSEREISDAPKFQIGDRVKSRNAHTAGHTRLPGYARGQIGEVVLQHGAHVFPDSHAHGGGEAPQHLYAVRFSAQTLWGPAANPNDSITLDLWESYLDAV